MIIDIASYRLQPVNDGIMTHRLVSPYLPTVDVIYDSVSRQAIITEILDALRRRDWNRINFLNRLTVYAQALIHEHTPS